MRRIIQFITTLSFLIFLPFSGFTQSGNWIKTIEADQAWVTDVKANNLVNVYVSGGFEGRIGLDAKDQQSSGDRAVFLAAFSEEGEKEWLKVFNGQGKDYINAMDVDKKGNVYLVLNFVETLSIEGQSYKSTSGTNIFIAKLSPKGKLIWGKHIKGMSNDVAHDIAVGKDGNFYLAGEFARKMKLSPEISIKSEGERDPFIAKFNTDCEVLWAENMKAGSDAQVHSVAVDLNNNLIIAGKFKGRIHYDTRTATAKDDIDLFAGKISPDGKALWLNGAGECNNDLPVQLVTDNIGNIIIAGSRNCETPFSEAAIQTFNENDVYFKNDMMLVKLDRKGEKEWMRTYNGSGNEKILDVEVDAENNIYFLAEHTNSISMKNNKAVIGAEKPYNFLLAKLNPGGELRWVEKTGGNKDPKEYCISVDLSSNVYMAGDFTGTENFRDFEITNAGNNREVFLWRLGERNARVKK